MDGSKKKVISKALVCAFPHTIPILAGFLFLGMAYGIYMNVSGFSFVYPMIMSAVIFGGSLEFVTVSMLLSAFAPIQTLLMAFMIQASYIRSRQFPDTNYGCDCCYAYDVKKI